MEQSPIELAFELVILVLTAFFRLSLLGQVLTIAIALFLCGLWEWRDEQVAAEKERQANWGKKAKQSKKSVSKKATGTKNSVKKQKKPASLPVITSYFDSNDWDYRPSSLEGTEGGYESPSSCGCSCECCHK